MQHGKALITGASSGIGAIYAERFAQRGYDPVLVARNENRLKAVASRIFEDTNRSVETIAADLANDADLVRVEQLLRSDARIEVLVNNAGIVLSGDVATADPGRLENRHVGEGRNRHCQCFAGRGADGGR